MQNYTLLLDMVCEVFIIPYMIIWTLSIVYTHEHCSKLRDTYGSVKDNFYECKKTR